MDAYEATKIVLQRIQNLDPENSSKIMGLLLIQDHGEKEMIRLAFGPETLLHSVILKARKELGVQTNSPSTPSTPSSPSPFSNPIPFSRQNSSSSSASSRFLGGLNLPSPLSIPNQSSSFTSSWAGSSFTDYQNPQDLISPSVSAASYGGAPISNLAVGNLSSSSSSSTMNSSAAPFYASRETDLVDEFQLQDQLSFLDDGSPRSGTRNSENNNMFYPQQDLASSPSGVTGGEAMMFSSYGGGATPNWGGSVNGSLQHRRSCSVNDIYLGSDDPSGGGLGWKPCLYFARGYCKNGSSCRFLHGGLGEAAMVGGGGGGDGAAIVGSPSKFEMIEQCQELLRSKSTQQQQRLAAASQLMASTNFPYSSMAADKCMNFLLQQQQLQVESPRSMLMGDDMNKFSRNRFDRSDFGLNGGPGMVNPVSRQIYLTFPADSTFKEEDVSNYFSIYGPVQDVRIPYQQKRMFGFVTFLYPETVKIILAKGNPHFVCDARVLVKPYKEKGKVPDKHRKQQLNMERGEFVGCGSPTGLESRDSFDLPLGARMFYNTQDILWRRKLEEQADLQQAIEMQNRRLMGLQLLDVKRNNHHRTLSTGAVISSPIHSPSYFNPNSVFSTERSSPEKFEGLSSVVTNPAPDSKLEMQRIVNVTEKENEFSDNNGENGNAKESPHNGENDSPESLEHNLPDSPFVSPKAAGEYITAFANNAGEAEKFATVSSPSLFPAATPLDIAPLKSCYFQVPRFAPGHGTIGM